MPSSPQWEAYSETEPGHGTQKKLTMSRKLIFLFLAVFGLIVLLRNISTMENIPVNLPTFHHNHTFCAHLGQKPSPQDELEERYLLDSIAWPGPPPSV